MSMMVSQITSLRIVYSIFYLSTDKKKHQSSALLAFVRGIHQRLVNSLHKGLIMRKMFPFDDIIMNEILCAALNWVLTTWLFSLNKTPSVISVSTWSRKRWVHMLFFASFHSPQCPSKRKLSQLLHAWLFLMLLSLWVFNIWLLTCISCWYSLPILIQCSILSNDISCFDDKLGMPKNTTCH